LSRFSHAQDLDPAPSPVRACLLIADAVVGDDRGEEYAAEVGQGVLVVAGGDAAPVLEAVEAAFDCVAVAVDVWVEALWASAS
jgi:hypothetical protein